MIKINSEAELIERLNKDIETSTKENIVLQAGHFPLIYTPQRAIEAINYWGEFSPYSLELACGIGKHAREIGKKVQFAFLVDDHSYERFNNLSPKQVRARRNRLYKEKSQPNAILHPEYQRIIYEFGFDISHVLRHDQGKAGRRNCLYFSEKVLRALPSKIINACAREYVTFIEGSYFDKIRSHLVSFVPNRCIGHICDVALDTELEALSSSHVFLETMNPDATKEELYTQGKGVTYRRDPE